MAWHLYVTRRTFLALLPTAPVAVPAAVKAVAAAPWQIDETSYTRFYARVTFVNVLTGSRLHDRFPIIPGIAPVGLQVARYREALNDIPGFAEGEEQLRRIRTGGS